MIKRALKRILPKDVRRSIRHGQDSMVEGFYRSLSWPLRRMSGGPEDTIRFLFGAMDFTPELVITAYHQGICPVACDSSRNTIWCDPDPRGLLPIADFHIPKELGRVVRQGRFEVRVDSDFDGVIRGCAEPVPGRAASWITPPIIEIYLELHRMGIAHSVEAWKDGGLVGGLYGLALGGYFSTESQFHRVRDAGKVALVALTRVLEAGGFLIHDVQWDSTFLQQFGCVAIPREEFKVRLSRALVAPASFDSSAAG